MTKLTSHKFLEYTLTALLILVPALIVPLGDYYDHFYYPKFMLLVVFAIIFLLYLLVNVHDVVKRYRPSWADLFLLIYTVLMIITSLFARDFIDALYGRAYRHTGLISHFIFVVLYFIAKINGNLGKRSWLFIVCGVGVLAFYGMMQYFGVDPIMRDEIRQGWNVAFSTFGNPNFAGSFYVMILPLSLYLVDAYGWKLYPLFAWILFSLLLTYSTASWIGGLLSLIIALALIAVKTPHNKQKRIFLKRTLVISALVVLLFNVFTSNAFFDEIGKTTGEAVDVVENGNTNQTAGSGRVFIWTKTIVLISQRPWLGFGVENMAEAFSQQFMDDMEEVFGFALTVDKAHNEYLQVAVDSGIPSLIIYLMFLLSIFFRSFRGIEHKRAHIFILSAVLGYLSQALFSFSTISATYLFWIILGILESGVTEEKAN
jgi:O-antigen ligase